MEIRCLPSQVCLQNSSHTVTLTAKFKMPVELSIPALEKLLEQFGQTVLMTERLKMRIQTSVMTHAYNYRAPLFMPACCLSIAAPRIKRLTGQASRDGLMNAFVCNGSFWTTHGEERREETEKGRNEPRHSYYGPDCIS
ncbi:hypothetical protein M413DRAFT_158200 [Hebeloma cylindrosporum]|uniref:Uncharacterized protein n=1 Tax=Hebeloma cylindrosporum TaxID=76867 RepID=A0A0C3CBP4_HEBCY|nr:hypothetical protein M413DRAFT_158200 [Hebeloma cylindrosporum h7]